jgi:hypothetical protein
MAVSSRSVASGRTAGMSGKAMNKWKVAFFVVLILGLASNGFLFHSLVDSAVSYSYLHDSYEAESRRFSALGDLVVAGADEYTQADILHLLRQANENAFIVEEDNVLHYEGVSFFFDADKLAQVE